MKRTSGSSDRLLRHYSKMGLCPGCHNRLEHKNRAEGENRSCSNETTQEQESANFARHTCCTKFAKDYNLHMPPRGPVLQMRYDENSIPVSAKCSMCGEQMRQSTPRIVNPIENVEWFAAQFSIHSAQIHPSGEPRKSNFGRDVIPRT